MILTGFPISADFMLLGARIARRLRGRKALSKMYKIPIKAEKVPEYVFAGLIRPCDDDSGEFEVTALGEKVFWDWVAKQPK